MANQELKLKEIQEKGFCNWCRNALAAQTEPITDKNLVDTGKSFGDGEKGYAVFCSECVQNEFRRNQPKTAINKKTGAEINIESLLESKQEAKAVQKDREETLKATGPTTTTTPTAAGRTVKLSGKLSDKA
jgi:hypothetical protein